MRSALRASVPVCGSHGDKVRLGSNSGRSMRGQGSVHSSFSSTNSLRILNSESHPPGLSLHAGLCVLERTVVCLYGQVGLLPC